MKISEDLPIIWTLGAIFIAIICILLSQLERPPKADTVFWLDNVSHRNVMVSPTNYQIGFRADGVVVWKDKLKE